MKTIWNNLKTWLGWLLANVIGVFIYLHAESWILAPRSERNSINIFDIISYYVTLESPLLFAFTVYNLIWLIFVVKHWRSNRDWQTLAFWFFVLFVWVVVVFGRGIGRIFL
jgi:hypothetical protein